MKARENPFRVARVRTAIRYARTAAAPDASRDGAIALLPRLASLGYRAAIVGPHGSGKTTLLEDLEHVLAQRGCRITHQAVIPRRALDLLGMDFSKTFNQELRDSLQALTTIAERTSP